MDESGDQFLDERAQGCNDRVQFGYKMGIERGSGEGVQGKVWRRKGKQTRLSGEKRSYGGRKEPESETAALRLPYLY